MDNQTKTTLLRMVDHTLLTQTATTEEIRQLAEDGAKYNVAMLCVPNFYIEKAVEFAAGRVRVGGLAGFPHGNVPTEQKCFEAASVFIHGGAEVDMVINLGMLREGNYKGVLDDIKAVKRVCGDRILKVIVETCLLTEEEKIKMCHIVTESGADFIKTSTGFSKGGATFEDVALFAANVGSNVRIKAAGGIRSFEDAQKFAGLGASRLGTSALVRIMKSEQPMGY